MDNGSFDFFVGGVKLTGIASGKLEADFIPQSMDAGDWVTPPAMKRAGEISCWMPLPNWKMARLKNLGWKKRRRWQPVLKAIRLEVRGMI